MSEWIFGLGVIWLGALSWFDLRRNEIPSSAWVIVPLAGALLYRVYQGGWQLVLLTILVAAASERERLSGKLGLRRIAFLSFWIPPLLLGGWLCLARVPLAALGILAFWIAWETGSWGGADAVASMTLLLVYPELDFLLVFTGVHLMAALVLSFYSLVREKRFRTHHIPGLPLLFLSVVGYRLVGLFY
ncbi:MAG: hypothetical protein NTZ74_01690 [Chloroflexi bacterium]|nr:hypothetical protein [Chloroflexota bacterium]